MDKIILDIKQAIEKTGLSEAKAARLAGLNQNKVNRMLSGMTKKIDMVAVYKLREALGVAEPICMSYGENERLSETELRCSHSIQYSTPEDDEEPDKDEDALKFQALPRRQKANIMEVVRMLTNAPAATTYEVLAMLSRAKNNVEGQE